MKILKKIIITLIPVCIYASHRPWKQEFAQRYADFPLLAKTWNTTSLLNKEELITAYFDYIYKNPHKTFDATTSLARNPIIQQAHSSLILFLKVKDDEYREQNKIAQQSPFLKTFYSGDKKRAYKIRKIQENAIECTGCVVS